MRVAGEVLDTFKSSGHPILTGTSPLSRGALKSKGGRKTSIHLQRGTSHCRVTATQNICRQFSSVYTEQSRIGAELLLSDRKVILHKAQENLLLRAFANIPCELVSGLTTHTTWRTPRPRETRCGNMMKSSKIIQKI